MTTWLDNRMNEGGVSALLDALSISLTYTPAGASGISTTGLWAEEESDPAQSGTGEDLIRGGTLGVPTSDVANPSHKDEATLPTGTDGANEIWQVDRIVNRQAGMVALAMIRVEPLRASGADFRNEY